MMRSIKSAISATRSRKTCSRLANWIFALTQFGKTASLVVEDVRQGRIDKQ
jgi:hypothetical protein